MGTKYQSFKVRKTKEDEAKGLEAQLADPLAVRSLTNPDRVRKRAASIRRQVHKITPPDYPKTSEGEAELNRDKARHELLATAFKNGNPGRGIVPMASRRQMDDNPYGSTRQHISHEQFWAKHTLDANGTVVPAKEGYGAKFELKDLDRRFAKHMGQEQHDPDCGNLEVYRPDAPVPLADNRAPVSFSMPRNVDQIFPDREPTDVEKKIQAAEQRESRVTCMGTKGDGKSCSSVPVKGSEFCRWHQPKE